MTNFAFVLLALKGMISCRRQGHDPVFLGTFSGYAIVGTGSMLFHSSLKYPMQLVDELSMIYTTCFSCYASFAHNHPLPRRIFVATFLIGLSIFITAYYHYIRDPTFHQTAYAILTATVLFRGFFVMETNLRPYWRGKPARETRESQRIDERDLHILSTMWSLVRWGLAIFLGGFAIWQLDNIHCSTIRVWRHQLGLPWGIILEGHGWWHLMTGLGAYYYITWVCFSFSVDMANFGADMSPGNLASPLCRRTYRAVQALLAERLLLNSRSRCRQAREICHQRSRQKNTVDLLSERATNVWPCSVLLCRIDDIHARYEQVLSIDRGCWLGVKWHV